MIPFPADWVGVGRRWSASVGLTGRREAPKRGNEFTRRRRGVQPRGGYVRRVVGLVTIGEPRTGVSFPWTCRCPFRSRRGSNRRGIPCVWRCGAISGLFPPGARGMLAAQRKGRLLGAVRVLGSFADTKGTTMKHWWETQLAGRTGQPRGAVGGEHQRPGRGGAPAGPAFTGSVRCPVWFRKRQRVPQADIVAHRAAEAFQNHPHRQTSSRQVQGVRKASYKALIDAGASDVANLAQGIHPLMRRAAKRVGAATTDIRATIGPLWRKWSPERSSGPRRGPGPRESALSRRKCTSVP